MQVQLKERHICYVTSQVLLVNGRSYDALLNRIAETVRAGGYQPDDMVPVDLNAQTVIDIFSMLGSLNERYAAAINAEMKTLLLPQLIAIGDEAAPVLAAMQDVDNLRNDFINQAIAEGRTWLNR